MRIIQTIVSVNYAFNVDGLSCPLVIRKANVTGVFLYRAFNTAFMALFFLCVYASPASQS